MPQYHIKHDDFFETVSNKNSNFDLSEPEWKRLSGLVKNGNENNSDSEEATSPACLNNTTILDDLSDINLSHDSEQDQREAGPNDQTETNPNHVHHQQETELNGSEGETTMDTIPNPSVTTRSGRDIRRTQHMEESAQQREQGAEAWGLLYDQDEVETKLAQNDQFILQRRLSNPMAFVATTDPHTMFYHKSINDPDHEQFR